MSQLPLCFVLKIVAYLFTYPALLLLFLNLQIQSFFL